MRLSDELFATLQSVRKLKKATAEQVMNDIGWRGVVTAINNRLRDLMELGYVKREKAPEVTGHGRTWLYSPAK